MRRIRDILVIVLTTAVVIFAMQNLHSVQVTFLLWGFEAKVTLVTFVPFLAGLVVGAAAILWWRRSRPEPRAPGSGETRRPTDLEDPWGT
jgi:uncharacterized integral membrane protein